MSSQKLRLLIVGGYGTFGGRIAQLLQDTPKLTLIVAGRSIAKAQQFCTTLSGRAEIEPAFFDRDENLTLQLESLKPDIVVDASGPFQHYGDSPYRLVEAAINCGIHYLDLADASGFVNGISVFDGGARAARVFVISGLSSFPVLTCAVARQLAIDMQNVTSVSGGIAPSPHAVVGRNVINAIASYAGQPIEVIKSGNPTTAFGLAESRYKTIKIDGLIPLPPTRFSLVDVPDLLAMQTLWPSVQSVWIGAGPRPEFLHRCLNLMAKLVSRNYLPKLGSLAPLMDSAVNLFRFGAHRGGMFISVSGESQNGETVTKTWNLIAEGDSGPMIPSMAVQALVIKILSGEIPTPGARAALREVDLSDYQPLFNDHAISTGVTCETKSIEEPLLYRRVLHTAYDRLHAPIRIMHEVKDVKVARGEASVTRGKSRLANFIANIIGFPAATDSTTVEVIFSARDNKEFWRRTFGESHFRSSQEFGTGRFDGLLVERFGPMAFGLGLLVKSGNLYLLPQRWSLFGIPMPSAFLPGGNTYETIDAQGRFSFHVEIVVPFAGLIVRYIGWLVPVPK